jgi:hypothetical protein
MAMSSKRTHRGYLVLLAALALPLVAARALDPVPWPGGQPPSPTVLDGKVNDAIELFDLERDEEFLEAYERGEDSEHIFVLQKWVDEGRFDLERLFQFGDSTFEHEFRRLDGYGKTELPRLMRVHDGAYGGLDTFSCAGCHQVGGVNGAGSALATSFYFGDGERLSSAVARNPPHVLGLGLVQALAVEMSAELQGARDRGLKQAEASGKPVTVDLKAKGVAFGTLRALPDGDIDPSDVEGVDEDLVVKPFGWKGHTARLRRFGERAARIHFGIQSHVLALEYQEDRDVGRMGPGPRWYDPDGDGKQRELEEGTLTALAIYMAMLEAPVVIPPHDPALRERWARGSALFDELRCSECHRRSLPLARREWHERSDTTDGEPVTIHLFKDGEKPRGSIDRTQLFSDLKRHDMGGELADPVEGLTGIDRSVFLTRPLWGLADSAPYLHDGRAATIPEAIRAHGGEAAVQRAAFVDLAPEQQANLHLFLLSLTREPKLRVPR